MYNRKKEAHEWYKKERICIRPERKKIMIQEKNHMYDARKKPHAWYKKERKLWYKKESTCMIQERNHMYDSNKKVSRCSIFIKDITHTLYVCNGWTKFQHGVIKSSHELGKNFNSEPSSVVGKILHKYLK